MPQTHVATSVDACFDSPALSARAIEGWLIDAGFARPVIVEAVTSTGSTNDDLLARARIAQPQHPIVRATDHQTAGRGRLRRPWVARERTAMLFSVALPLHSLPAALPAITLACGVGIAEFLDSRGVPVELKWPNDVRIGGCKLAGTLSELAVDGDGRSTLVIGVGVNGWLDAHDRASIDQPAVALSDFLAMAEVAAEREAWIGRLAGVILDTVERFIAEGFAPFRARFNALLESRGSIVGIVDGGDSVVSGRLLEADALGRLLVQTDAGTRAISVGDVSVRGSRCAS